MADEDVTPTEEVVSEPVVENEATEAPVVEDPHPLDPGGKRFAEVYGEMKEARREAQDLRDRLSRMEGAVAQQQAKPVPQQPVTYTSAQLQAAVDTGKITPAQMADQLAWQRAKESEAALEYRLEAKRRNETALNEINQYVEKIPSLRSASSPEFAKVATVAREIAEELGKSVDDPLVQKRALREAFGTLERLTKVKEVAGTARGLTNMDSETRGSSGVNTNTKADPLKDVPQMYKDHWKKLGYTQAQMESEAKFIKPRRVR